MGRWKIEYYLTNDQVILAGHGIQSEGDEDHGSKRLKFARFKILIYDDSGIRFGGEYAGTCKGRS